MKRILTGIYNGMAHTTQSMSGDTSLHDLKKVETSAPGGTVSASVGENGFIPAVQAGYTLSDKPAIDGEKVNAGASITATLGVGISVSAYVGYELNQGPLQVRLGLSAEYNRQSGASVGIGGRVDYNSNTPITPYASAIVSTKGKSALEVGGCTDVTVLGQTGSVCGGVQYSNQGTKVVVGFGRSF